MLIVALVSWWYTDGWAKLGHQIGQRIVRTLDFFSVNLLLQTLFDPFRQIAAGRTQGPVGVQLRAWVDRLFSRLVGMVVRTIIILVGLLVVAAVAIIGLAQLLFWPLVPLLPVIAMLGMTMGWKLL